MLGPLEAVLEEQPLALGGAKQRATLGFLLLRANKVVATSQLLKALWPEDETPNSARKILQNTVWGLRRVLSANGDGNGCAPDSPWVHTQPPGYMLSVRPDQIDLFQFRTHVEEGRAQLAAGAPDTAARRLKEALALWRGPVLSDLVETGVSWPELAAVQGARLDALEDYFEAELARGRHQTVLGELETLTETEPLRERACGQLMLALYRCGRQADALNVYARVRNELVENLGLEPGHDLRMLQQAILNHDPAVLLPGSTSCGESLIARTAPRTVALLDRVADGLPADPLDIRSVMMESEIPICPEESRPHAQIEQVTDTARPVGETTAVAAVRRHLVSERKRLGVVLMNAELTACTMETPAHAIDRALTEIAAAVREEVERWDGTLVATIGSISLALFGVHRQHSDDPARAVRAALAVRDRLQTRTEGTQFRAAIDIGDVLVHYQPDDESVPPLVAGRLVDGSHGLLAQIPAGEIRVSDTVHCATETAFDYAATGSDDTGWSVAAARPEHLLRHDLPIVDREYELDVLCRLLELAGHRRSPHLVTLLGEHGVGKTRLVLELGRRVAGRPDGALFLAATVPAAGQAGPLAVQSDILRAYCGILPGDSRTAIRAKLGGTLRDLTGDEERAGRMLPLLLPLALPQGADPTEPNGETLGAWRSLLADAARGRPVVLVVDDLHRADDALLDFVEELPRSVGRASLVVIAAADPELRERRPDWSTGTSHTTTLSLAALSDTAVDQLLDHLVAEPAGAERGPDCGLRRTLQGPPRGAADDRRRQIRELLRLAAPRA
ncbi:BTAD domain-containing putative transcriptional regulator [Streptomyces sp. NPDC059176]|uniref:BTAD domain-containing putative transcriptional regulator n=1 Tax=unclassified Streptomyces TaxID=2593676 RepID=UPI003694ECAB